jgi:hypothetical protein
MGRMGGARKVRSRILLSPVRIKGTRAQVRTFRTPGRIRPKIGTSRLATGGQCFRHPHTSRYPRHRPGGNAANTANCNETGATDVHL